MFVCTFRASSLKFLAVIVLTLAVLVGAIAVGQSGAMAASVSLDIDFSGIKTNDDRVAFIEGLGYKVKGEPVEEVSFSMPKSLDGAMQKYNEIQKSQGLDLTRYKNKKLTRYTYAVENYPDYDGEVYVNLILYRKTVVACDISSASPDGFIKPLVSLS